MFEKKCMKVSDNLIRVQHKLNNDGHTSVLRRLPPSEREKLKQHAEAESMGMFICPEEVKACDRSVPYCSHLMRDVGGYGKGSLLRPDAVAADDEPPPPPARGSTGGRVVELVDDDMLLEIKRSDDDLDELLLQGAGGDPASSKAKKKNKSSKKGQTLILDWKTSNAPTSAEDSDLAPSASKVQPTTTRNPGGIGAAQQAWSAVASRNPAVNGTDASPTAAVLKQPVATRRPADFEAKVRTLVSMAGCSEARATQLLEQNDWHLNRAADAFFASEAAGADSDGPRWGPSRTSSQGKEEMQQARPQPPAPSQPPPPPLPHGWLAVWNEEHRSYYYWHQPTNHTTWDAPQVQDDDELQPAPNGSQGPSQETLISRLQEITTLSESAARALLESHAWDVDAAAHEHRRAQEEERKRKAAEEAARRQAEEAAAVAAAAAAAAAKAAAEKAALEEAAEVCRIGLNVCYRHWRLCLPGLESCIRLIQGEQVEVTWLDEATGWAYGHTLHDPSRRGYFPQEVVRQCLRPTRAYVVGEACQAIQRFEAPPDIGGYLSLEVGDVLTVLHPVVEPAVWAYVERGRGATADRGWAPATALGEYAKSGLQPFSGPQRAG